MKERYSAPNSLPQLQETQPTIHQQQVNAGSYESFAHVLGKISENAGEETKEILKDHSQAMYVQSVSDIEHLKMQSQMQMLQHPDQAAKISQNMENDTAKIKELAYVDKQDRSRLNEYISSSNDEVKLKAVEAQVKQTKLQTAFTHYQSWPGQMKARQDALMAGNDKLAAHLENSMIDTLKNLVMTGVITPHEAASSIKSMHDIMPAVQNAHELYGNPNSSAKDFHEHNAHPLNNSPSDPNHPMDGNTQWQIDYYNNDHSFQSAKADVNQGMLPAPQTYYGLTDMQQKEINQMFHGRSAADGLINSGEAYPVIKAYAQSLSEPGRILNAKDNATKARLDNYLNELDKGNFLEAISTTPAGAKVSQDFVNKSAAIESMDVLNPEYKQQQIAKFKDEAISQAVSVGRGKNIPSDKIQPIPKSELLEIQNGFKLGQDPNKILKVMSQYSKPNQAYIAQAITNPNQRMALQAITYADHTVSPSQKTEFLASVQDNRSYAEFDKSLKSPLRSAVATELSQQLKLVANDNDPNSAQILQNAMIDNTVKYALFLAQKKQDFGMTSWGGSTHNYAREAAQVYQGSHTPRSGTNYMVNDNALPEKLTNTQLAQLAQYATDKGADYLKGDTHHTLFDRMLSRNPLKMVISSTHDVMAVDGNGKAWFTVAYSPDVLADAELYAVKKANAHLSSDPDLARQQARMRLIDQEADNSSHFLLRS